MRTRTRRVMVSGGSGVLEQFEEEVVHKRRLKALDFLLQTQPLEYFKLVHELIDTADLGRGLDILQAAHKYVSGGQAFQGIVTHLEERFGDRIQMLLRSIEELARKDTLKTIRDGATGIEERFVLGAVQNVPDCSAILRLIEARFPGRDAAELAAKGCLPALRHAKLPSDELATRCLASLFSTGSLEAAKDRAGAANAAVKAEQIAQVCEALHRAAFLAPLWRN